MATGNNLKSNIGRYWIDQPQSIALASDCFIFLTGGFHLAVSLGWSFVKFNLHFQICWFIGVVIGCILAALLISWQQQRRYFILSATLLVTVSAIISIAASSNENALIAARYLNGIAIGLTTISFITHGSEIASEYHRGFCLSLEQLCLTSGAAIQIICATNWTENLALNPFCMQGILCLLFGVFALLTTFKSIDSPVEHLRSGNEPEALSCVVRLYRPTVMTNDKQLIFNKLKEYVLMNESLTWRNSFLSGLSPLARLLVYRSMLAFIRGLPLTAAFIMAAEIAVGGTGDSWPFIVYGFVGVIGVLVGITTMDAIGRKAVSLFSLLCVAGMTIGVGILFQDSANLINSTKMAIVCSLSLIGQVFGGIFAPSTTVYLGEAYPLLWKRYYVSFTVIVQYLVDLIVVCLFTVSAPSLFVFGISAGVIMFVGLFAFLVTMPETRKNTLGEAQEQFLNFLHLRFY